LKREAKRAPFKTTAWYKATDDKNKLKATDDPLSKRIKSFTSKPHGWKSNPVQAFVMNAERAEAKKAAATPKHEEAKAKAEAALARAREAEAAAESAGFKNAELNAAATKSIDEWREAQRKASGAKKKTSVSAYNQIPSLLGLMIALGVFFSIGMKFLGTSLRKFIPGFLFVFLCPVGHRARAHHQQYRRYPAVGHAGSAGRVLY
jgi:uncharacterized membrane protein